MFTKITKCIILSLIALTPLTAQPWNYDFGDSSRSWSSGVTTTFMPIPPSGTARLRVGTGGGSFNLENQLIPFGSETYFRIAAPTGGSVNKFSVYDYPGGKCFTINFRIRFGSNTGLTTANSGIFSFLIGDGASFSDNNVLSGTNIFAGLRFTFSSGGIITTNVRNGSNWVSTGIPANPVSQLQDYIVEIYGNNSTSEKTYIYETGYTVGANKWDLWVNGTLIGDELTKGQLSNDANIDSWMIYGETSTGNVANIFLDDFYYHNDIAGTPLPVSMGSFELNVINRSALLSWNTLSEINNSGFVVERCMLEGTGETEWINAGFVRGYGTTNEPRVYSFEDAGLKAGRFKYRLKQVDYNGNFEYFTPANIQYAEIIKPAEFFLGQNYPNPSNPVTTIDYQVPFESMVNLTVYDVTGRSVKELVNAFQSADYYSVTFDGSDLATGVYFYRIHGTAGKQAFSKTIKMMLIK
ncbi:MAG TPA: hypothetical protein DCX92_11485 [Bacteroidetes bacterium]|nr:hypothetical protein [Bacteroidota bacterium]HRJ84233.1 T9SS type A sorting domain-containing protein [Ignavibacteria bacterium]